MVTEAINHDPAHTFMNTGTTISGRPAMGSWLTYGLGSESEDLPGFVVLTSTGRFGQAQPISTRQWHSGFLPSRFQGVRFYSKGDPVLYLGNPEGTTVERQRDVVDAVQRLNQLEEERIGRPRDRHADRRLRDGLPDAGQRPRADRPLERAEARAGPLRHRGGRRLVRGELPAGPPAGRARRPVHPALPPRLGPPRRDQGARRRHGARGRPGRRRR